MEGPFVVLGGSSGSHSCWAKGLSLLKKREKRKKKKILACAGCQIGGISSLGPAWTEPEPSQALGLQQTRTISRLMSASKARQGMIGPVPRYKLCLRPDWELPTTNLTTV